MELRATEIIIITWKYLSDTTLDQLVTVIILKKEFKGHVGHVVHVGHMGHFVTWVSTGLLHRRSCHKKNSPDCTVAFVLSNNILPVFPRVLLLRHLE